MSNYIINDGELMHYGVLGMKWGKRRALRYADNAKYAKESAKEWGAISKYQVKKQLAKGNVDKANKLKARYKKYAERDLADAKKYAKKSKEIERKHIELAGSKKAYEYTTRQSTGKLVIKSLLMGTYGALKYDQVRSKHTSRGKAAAAGALGYIANDATMGIAGIVEPRINRKKK